MDEAGGSGSESDPDIDEEEVEGLGAALNHLFSHAITTDGTGFTQWPAGCALSEFVVQQCEAATGVTQPQSVIELGAGTGSAALEASRFCSMAVLSDGNPDMVTGIKLLFLRASS